MTVTVDNITAATRDVNFSHTVTASGDAGETITGVSVVPIEKDSGITITGANISGKYISTFIDILKYVDKGSSDRLQTPVTLYNTADIPEGKDLFSFKQDQRDYVDKQYKVTVNYTLVAVPYTIEVIAIQTVANNSSAGLAFLTGYIGRNG